MFPGSEVHLSTKSVDWTLHRWAAQFRHWFGIHDFMPVIEYWVDEDKVSPVQERCSICKQGPGD